MRRPSCPPFWIPLFSSALVVACSPSSGPPAPPPLPEVDALIVERHARTNYAEFPGRIQAVRTAEVRARTDGIVLRRLYQEGTDVAAGAALFRIDPRDYQAQTEQARAALARATAARDNAAQVVRRYTPLIAERAISEQELDQARATLRQEQANVADARAAVTRAKLSLSYTTIRAPIAGRVGRAQVTEGALVSGSSATLMTTVDQLSPAYAVFTIANPAVSDVLDQARAGSLILPDKLPARIILPNGKPYPLPGVVDFAAETVDTATGTQTFRATFRNPEHRLLPGQFVQISIAAGINPNGIVVPARAVRIAGDQASVTVIGRGNIAAARPVTVGARTQAGWAVTSGLHAGERIAIDGWQKVQPGQRVTVRKVLNRNQGGVR